MFYHVGHPRKLVRPVGAIPVFSPVTPRLVDVKTRVLPKSIAIKTEKSPLYFARARAPIAVRLVAIVALLWVDVLACARSWVRHGREQASASGAA